jgi:hypothetical protein
MSRLLRLATAATMGLLGAACEVNHAPTETAPFAVRFAVTNHLVAPVTISIDTVPYAILLGGKSTTLTVPSTVPSLTWTSAKAAGSNRVPIPDDIGENKVSVAGIGSALEITNVINDQTYITAGIYNTTAASVSIGVYDGTSVSCAAELPAAVGVARGFTQTGYYKLLPTTELRAYHAPSGCTGAFTTWPSAQIKSFAAKSGLLTLTLDSAP